MTHNDLEIDLVFNNLTDDILKELESLGQLPPNQYWLTPDASSDNTITDAIAELNTIVNGLTVSLNNIKTDVTSLQTASSTYVTLTTEQTISGVKKMAEAKFPSDTGSTDYRYPLTVPTAKSTEKRFILGIAGTSKRWTNVNDSVYMQSGKLYSNNTEVSVTGHTHTKANITDFDHTHNYLPTIGGTLTGHTYFKGGSSNSSTSNTAQIVMQRSDGTQQWALTSNDNMFIINPSTTSTTGQLVCNLGSKLYMSGADLGTSSYKWNNVYISGTLYIG